MMAKARGGRNLPEKKSRRRKIKIPWWYIFFAVTFNTNAAPFEELGLSKHVLEKGGKGE